MPYVKSAEKVRRAIFFAIEEVGMEDFLKQVDATREEVENWLVGDGWIPLKVVTAACKLGKGRLGALSRMSELIEGLDVIDDTTYDMLSKRAFEGPSVEAPVSAPTQKKRAIELKAEQFKRQSEMSRTFSWLLLKSTLLIIGMLVGSFVGYIIGSRFGILYAGLGMFVPIIVGIILTLLWSLRVEHK